MKNKIFYTYIVFDGRANYDIDSASIMEYAGEFTTTKEALKFLGTMWNEHDAVLVRIPESSKNHDDYEIVHNFAEA